MPMEDPRRAEWYKRFDAWLEAHRPFLEQHNFREGLEGYIATLAFVNRSVPWTPWEKLGKPLSEARLAFVSSCGAYIAGEQDPYDAHNYMGDTTYRTLPWDVDKSRIRIAHEHYDHTAVDQDLSSVLPLDLLKELKDQGAIGELVEPVYVFSGYLLDVWKFKETSAREIAYRIVQSGADSVL
ncbi:MAG: hypothetical protein FJ315_03930, partial [SAR202 cluster bacterium]|nr:hypothetical protein [SAR202 cluster bacterium]